MSGTKNRYNIKILALDSILISNIYSYFHKNHYTLDFWA